MTDDVKALTAEARNRTTEHARQNPEGSVDLALRLADALEAATSAPAVDREAMASVLEKFIEGLRAERRLYPDLYRLELADVVIAHLGARDVRDVQAEGADLAADWLAQQLWPDAADYAGHVRQFAQAIREARP